MRTAICVFGYDLAPNMREVGKRTGARLKRGLEVFAEFPEAHFLLTAGFRRDVYPRQGTSIALAMWRWLHLYHGVPRRNIHCAPVSSGEVCGTVSEHAAMLALARKHRAGKIIFVSDSFHVPRIFVAHARKVGCIRALRELASRRIAFRTVRTWPPPEVLREIAATAVLLVFGIESTGELKSFLRDVQEILCRLGEYEIERCRWKNPDASTWHLDRD